MKKKRLISTLLVICMVFAIMPTANAYSTVRKGSSGSDVRTLQTMLNTVMSAGLSVDGSFGSKTLAAVKSYQSYKGLSVDGICGPKTWSALEADYKAATSAPDSSSNTTTVSHATVRYGSSGAEVKTLQTYLNQLIGAGLTVDGKFGSATQKAVKSYQSSKGLTADGICGPKTWAALEADVATPPSSTLTIGSGRYTPGTLTQGTSYSISGTISSNYSITSVTVGVYDASGNATSYVKTVTPNAYSYNIYGVDASIKFGKLQGSENGTTYYFRVTATDSSGTTKQLVNNSFIVKSRTIVNESSSEFAKMAKATHEVQGSKMCVLTSYSMLVKAKLYSEGKSYSHITQSVVKNSYNGGVIDAYWGTINSNINASAGTSGTITKADRAGYTSAQNKQYIIDLLSTRPEGVLVYCYKNRSNQHAVRFCNYDAATPINMSRCSNPAWATGSIPGGATASAMSIA
jgi:peptidoglycan hydrolase-like protein with peptidoglycan-binding domain